MDSVLRQASLSVTLADVVGQSSAKRTVGVDDIALNASGETLLQSKLRLGDELVVEADMKTAGVKMRDRSMLSVLAVPIRQVR
jgi:hypothetical protein